MLEAPETNDEPADDNEAAEDTTLPQPVVEVPTTKAETIKANDIAILPGPDGEAVTNSIIRFERALSE